MSPASRRQRCPEWGCPTGPACQPPTQLGWELAVGFGPVGAAAPGKRLLRNTEAPGGPGALGLCHPPAGTLAGPTAPQGSSLGLTSLTMGSLGRGRDTLPSAILGEAQ